MGGDDSQKLRPWRGAISSLGRSKPPAHCENQHSSGKRRASLPGTYPGRASRASEPVVRNPENRYNVKVHAKITQLTNLIDEAQQLLRKHGEETWANWLEEGCSRIRDRDFAGVQHILSGFGGMGSFNDLYICPTNHHVIEERNVDRVNNKLRALSSEIYKLARDLQNEDQAAQANRD